MNEFLSQFGLSIEMITKTIIVILAIIVVFFVAKIISAFVGSLISKCKFIRKLFKKVGVKLDMDQIGKIVEKVLYIILIVATIVSGLVWLQILTPNALGVLINDYLLAFLNAAGLAVIAWFLAVLTKTGIVKALETTQIDEKIGDSSNSTVSISESLSVVGFWGVILYFIPQILAKLGQDELLAPITGIINDITAFIPQIIGAGIIIVIAYFIGKFISKLVTELLSGLGFDKVLGLVGIKNSNSSTTPSGVIGKLVFVYIVLFAVLEAASKIGFDKLSDIVNKFIGFGSNILIGVIIFAIGMYLANLAANAVQSATSSKFLPKITKAAIIVVTTFMGLEQMELGQDIINQAFTLSLGAIAVAFALAVGLGAKEVAGEEVKKLLENIRK